MFIPLKMVLIGIDPYPYVYIHIYIYDNNRSNIIKHCVRKKWGRLASSENFRKGDDTAWPGTSLGTYEVPLGVAGICSFGSHHHQEGHQWLQILIRFVPSPGLQRRTHPGTVEFQMSGCRMLPIFPLHSQVTKLSPKACSLEKYRNVAYLLHICAPRYLALGRFYTGPKSFKLLLYIISFHWNILQVQTSRSSSYIKLRRTGSVPIDLLFLPTLWPATGSSNQPVWASRNFKDNCYMLFLVYQNYIYILMHIIYIKIY